MAQQTLIHWLSPPKLWARVTAMFTEIYTNSLTGPQRTAVNALTAIATADANDPATTQAMANEAKAKINAIIAALKAT